MGRPSRRRRKNQRFGEGNAVRILLLTQTIILIIGCATVKFGTTTTIVNKRTSAVNKMVIISRNRIVGNGIIHRIVKVKIIVTSKGFFGNRIPEYVIVIKLLTCIR